MAKNQKKKNILILVVIILLVFIALTLSLLFGSRSEKVAKNPEGTIGNTAGNLNNSGLFCEQDGIVYFANAFDNDTLYSMDVNEGNIKKLSSVRVCNLLAGGDYLYYFQLGESGATGLGGVRTPHTFNRCHTDGSKTTSLIREVIVTGQLVKDTLYLLGTGDDGPYFISLGTDGKNRTLLANYIVNPASAQGSTIYYNGTTANHYLYALDTNSGNANVLLTENIWYPCVQGDWVYYMDAGNDYQLRRYSISQNIIEILSKEKVQSFNVGHGYIYYQTMGNDAHFSVMNADGSNDMLIAVGQYCNINLTSQFVYFQDYFNDETIYHAYLGSGSFSSFSAAIPTIQ